MAFKRLGPIVKQVVSRLVIDAGEGSGGTLPDAEKDAGTEAPASDYMEIVPTSSGEQAAPVNPANGRPIVTASPTSLPRSAVSIGLVLVVDNGEGGRPAQGGAVRAAYARARSRGRNLASNLRLVSG